MELLSAAAAAGAELGSLTDADTIGSELAGIGGIVNIPQKRVVIIRIHQIGGSVAVCRLGRCSAELPEHRGS